jgi:hypothetical protein
MMSKKSWRSRGACAPRNLESASCFPGFLIQWTLSVPSRGDAVREMEAADWASLSDEEKLMVDPPSPPSP